MKLPRDRRSPHIEALESRRALSATSWLPRVIESSSPSPSIVGALDLDADGDIDVASTEHLWLQNETGQFRRTDLSEFLPRDATPIKFADVNADELIDIVFSRHTADGHWQIGWLEGQGGVTFGDEQLIGRQNQRPRDVLVLDVDADGDNDVMITTVTSDYSTHSTHYFENIENSAFLPSITLIDAQQRQSVPYDADGDGDKDLAFITPHQSHFFRSIRYIENDGGFSNESAERQIPEISQVSSFHIADFDNDARDDLLWLGRNANLLLTAEENYSFARPESLRSLSLGDVDSDGDVDLVASSFNGGGIKLLLNDGGRFSEEVVAFKQPGYEPEVRAVADVNQDGIQDFLTFEGTYGELAWLVSTQSKLQFVYETPLVNGTPVAGHVDFKTIDFDSDSDEDLLVLTTREVLLYKNDGAQFERTKIANVDFGRNWTNRWLGDPYAEPWIWPTLEVLDVDSDGDSDFVFASGTELSVFTNSAGVFQRQRIFHDSVGDDAFDDATERVTYASRDFNGDGSIDLVISSRRSDEAFVYLGNGGRLELHQRLDGGGEIRLLDVDGDNESDLFLSSTRWVEREPIHQATLHYGNAGIFEAGFTLPALPNYSFSDFDGDDHLEFVAHDDGGCCPVLVGRLNKEGFEIELDELGRGVAVGDFDGDEDPDLLVEVRNFDVGNGFELYENKEGTLEYISTLEIELDVNLALMNAVDADDDGDLDIVAGSQFVPAWRVLLENTDGKGDFATTIERIDPIDLLAQTGGVRIDFDNDGDFDVFATGHHGMGQIYRNDDGAYSRMNFGTLGLRAMHQIFSLDIDQDGDDDLVSLEGSNDRYNPTRLLWYENRVTGDADDDGKVDFNDFLALSANFGNQTESAWEDGDFNLDGAVSFADFLLMSENFGRDQSN